jgi:curved DNA-binding protein CbpA
MARVALDPLAQIWQFIKVNLAPAELNVALARLGSREVKLHAHSRVQRFGFSIKIQNLLDVVRTKPQTLDALRKTGLVDPDTLHRVLYTLAVTRHLDMGREDLEPMGVGGFAKHSVAPRVDSGMQLRVTATPRNESAPSERAQGNAALRLELEQLLGKLDSLNHYQLLALPDDAQVPAIQSAFLVLAKKWHPDRWRGDLSDANRDASRVFARLREAYQTLTDDTLRAAYDTQRQSKKDEEAEQDLVRQILHAAGQFHQAQILAKKHDFAAAEALAYQAFQEDPTQLEYGAFYAWAAVQNPQRKEKDFDGLIGLLNHAVADSKDNVQLRYYRAVVLKRAGRLQEAIKDFHFVHEVDPKHVEAAREIRLFAKRADEAREAREETGRSGAFIKKLFVK